MSTLVLRSQELVAPERGIKLDLMSGTWREPAGIRGGADILIPGKAGMMESTPRVKDSRRVLISGYVSGHTAGTLARQWELYDENMRLVDIAIGAFSALTTLVAHAPYLGLQSGTATLSSVHVDQRGPMWGPIEVAHRRVSFYLVAIGDPPDWVLAP